MCSDAISTGAAATKSISGASATIFLLDQPRTARAAEILSGRTTRWSICSAERHRGRHRAFLRGREGFSPETFRVIQSWPEIGRADRYVIRAAATVICCGQRQLNQLSKPRSAVAQAVFLVLEPAL